MSSIERSRPLAVRASSHARVTFDAASPPAAELVIEYLAKEKLLARERRPIPPGIKDLEIKTHPAASHVSCALYAGDEAIGGVRFSADCGQDIQPTARHFIVIGAMKAGTTTLFELLAQHPALCRTWAEVPDLSFGKEINYFRKLYARGHKPIDYDWRFPFDPARHAWTLDVSPSYAKWPASKAVPARVASLGGETKLAYILRDPIDRIESHFAHKLRRGGNSPRLKHCIRVSSYAMQLDKYMKHFERSDILLLDFEQLRRNPALVQEQICDFLGIDRFIARSVVHNRRSVAYRLDGKERAELAETLRPDVARLVSMYGFKPAEKWLRRSVLKRLTRAAFGR